MSVIESFFFLIAKWFGYVGACIATPDATCRPFLAFLALGAASCAALTLVLMAYRAARARDDFGIAAKAIDSQAPRERARAPEFQPQPRARRAPTSGTAVPAGLRAAA
jgi:hypothetical protein